MTRVTRSLICAAAITACGDAAAPAPTGDPSGVYAYLARVGLTPVVEGRMTLVVGDSIISGTWELRRVPGSDTGIAVGPQLGTGTLQGRRTASELWLDLNPGWADNNVFLVLQPEVANGLAGTWDHSTIIGPVTGGPVQLRRVVR
jgi:hypothetical protein